MTLLVPVVAFVIVVLLAKTLFYDVTINPAVCILLYLLRLFTISTIVSILFFIYLNTVFHLTFYLCIFCR